MKAAVLWIGYAMLTTCCAAAAQSFAVAKNEARLGRVDTAVAALKAAPKSAENDALLCTLYSSVDQFDDAVPACEAAAAAAPSSSNYTLALARAYGAKAAHAGALTGMRLVGKIRGSFERAVQLDPNNVEALSDLGQFYVEAPGMVGGGVDKARALVLRLQPLSPARSHRLSAMIAAKQKNDAHAEQEYQAELAVAQSAEAYVDLASFYRSHKQWDKAEDSAKQALEHDPRRGPDTLDATQVLIDMKRDAPAVQSALRGYLKAPQGNVASYAKANVLLAGSLSNSGDAAGAKAAYQAALSLARDYAPAKQGLGQ